MKNVLMVTICVWIMLAPAWATLVLDLGGATEDTYSNFLTELRTEMKDKKVEYYTIPMMPPPSNPLKYLLVELKVSKDISITLSLGKNDLYVLGYSDMYQGKCRYHVFSDHDSKKPPFKQHSLCKGAKDAIRKPITYSSNYKYIEDHTGNLKRKDIGLGVDKLKSLIPKVYGINTKSTNDEATFLLAAIQTVSEAARFIYIQGIANEAQNPDATAICLENNWAPASKQIYNQFKRKISQENVVVEAKTDKFELKLKGIPEIKKHISLLHYEAATSKSSSRNAMLSFFSRLLTKFVGIGNHDGDKTEL